MRFKNKILIIGGGAVGRGLIAPKLIDAGFMVTIADVDRDITDRLATMKYYPLVGRGIFKWIGPVSVWNATEIIYPRIAPSTVTYSFDFDYIFISVKANNLSEAAKVAKFVINNNKKNIVVYIIENLMSAADKFCKLLDELEEYDTRVLDGIANVVVPVSPHQEQDPTFTVYDPNMELVLVKSQDTPFINTAKYVTNSEFDFEWFKKFYLHCSVHAFVAYWGIEHGFEYIHEVVTSSPHDAIVSGFINLVGRAMKFVYPDRANEIDERGKFEFRCMADHLMMDDCYRVARDPVRKLEYDERLIGLMYFIRKSLGDTICEDDTYKRLVHVTNSAIRKADLTPDSLLELDSWKTLPEDILKIFNDGVIEELRNDWKERFSDSSDC